MTTTNTSGAQQTQTNPPAALLEAGQSIWLDYITRSLVRSGELQQMIEQDGVRGMTSNPTIFEKAISDSSDYDEQIQTLAQEGHDASTIFEKLEITDIQAACDRFLPLYERTNGQDGFVSIEVAPDLAHNTDATISEARRLWQAVDRPNLMVKVPGTKAGIPAVEQLLREGLNINVTLLFSIENHERVMWSYIKALEERQSQGQPIDRIASVASFFVSRVDTLVDTLLDEKIAQANGDAARQERLQSLRGKAAVANAKAAYARFQEVFSSERFQQLKQHGARPQRVLWASTSTKNPDYRDVYYVESLIGPDTINSMPPQTLEALQDHGEVRRTIDEHVNDALAVLSLLKEEGIDYDAVTQQLEDEGVEKFATSYNNLTAAIEQKLEQQQGQSSQKQPSTATNTSFETGTGDGATGYDSPPADDTSLYQRNTELRGSLPTDPYPPQRNRNRDPEWQDKPRKS